MNKTLKVLLLGPSAAGKTAMAKRIKFRRFDQEYVPTIGVELYDADFKIEDAQYRLLLCDTDSEMGYDLLDREFARGTNIVLLIADATRRETVDSMVALKASIDASSRDMNVVVATNKSDDHGASGQWVQEMQSAHPEVVLVSAKTGHGVNSLLAQVVQRA